MIKGSQPTIAITGASGFLGGVLVDHFLQKNWQVIALVRNTDGKLRKGKGLEYRAYDITKPISNTTLHGVDYLVHAAYVKLDAKHPDAMDLNITGAKNILATAKKQSVKQSVFISTMSAHEEAISVYGKQKLTIESLFLKNKSNTVLRCGLIIGKGGIVHEMASFMKSKHAVPLVGGGKQPLQIISVYDLAQVIENTLERSLTGRFIAATPEVYSYKEFYAALAKELGVKIAYIPVPYGVLEAIFRTAAFLHIPLGVGEDNLKGLKKLKSMSSEKDMQKIGVKPLNLSKALARSGIKG